MMKNDNNVQLTKKIQVYLSQINQYKKLNKYKRCYKLYEKIIDCTKNNPNIDITIIYGETLHSMGELLLHKLYNSKEAASFLLESLNILKQVNSEKLHEIYCDLFKCFIKMGDSNQIIFYGELLLNSFSINKDFEFDIHAHLGRHYLISYYQTIKKNNLYRAISHSSTSIELYKKIKNAPISDYINCLYDCGEISFLLDDYELSIKYFDEILTLSTSVSVSEDLLYGLYDYIKQIYQFKGYKDTALYYNRKLLDIECHTSL